MHRDAANEPVAVPYVLDDGEGEVIRWFGDTITVKSSGPRFDIAVITAVAGSEPPLHVHTAADEALFVLEGSLEVVAGDETFAASVGAFVFLPHGVPHTFSIGSGSARLLAIAGPSGLLAMHSDAEERFGSREMPARPRATDLAAVAPVLEAHGVTVLDVPTKQGRDVLGNEITKGAAR
jgi:quercetin dioxygenase-like cupin family protein